MLRSAIRDVLSPILRSAGVWRWKLSGRPAPPPHSAKQKVVKEFQKRFKLTTFVETGTYLGDMVNVAKGRFSRVYSIELSSELAANAQRRFATDKNVTILAGDSSELLPSILAEINTPCLFWLDGHFSGGNTARGNSDYPILGELTHIAGHSISGHVILIDDARLFTGEESVPSRAQIYTALTIINRLYVIKTEDDIIRAYLP